MKPALLLALLLPALVFLGGCASTIQPLRPMQEVEYWVPAHGAATAPATSPATAPATARATQTIAAPATSPATQPGMIRETRLVDPNQTVRYLYRGSYDHIWQEAMNLLTHCGFRLDRQDYRLGILTTLPLHQPEFLEFWRRDNTDLKHALEASVNDQRHIIRLTISPVPGRPDFYAIAIQALVERQINPTEVVGGLLFSTGSAFGATPVILRSDYAEIQTAQSKRTAAATSQPGTSQPAASQPATAPSARHAWVKIGHDAALEKKLLDLLFQKI